MKSASAFQLSRRSPYLAMITRRENVQMDLGQNETYKLGMLIQKKCRVPQLSPCLWVFVPTDFSTKSQAPGHPSLPSCQQKSGGKEVLSVTKWGDDWREDGR